MAIQMRRGAYANFDPSRMVQGEWGVVTSGDPIANDGMAAYMCFVPGTVKRMSTYEDMADWLENNEQEIIETLTDAANAATAAANSAAASANSAASSANTAAASAAAQASAASDAAASANTAATGANEATTSASNAAGAANQAANNATNALEAIATYIPISAGNILTGQLNGPGVQSASDAYAGGLLKGFSIEGISVQDGTPTPSAPVPIKSVAECDMVTAIGNLFDYATWVNGVSAQRGTLTLENNGATLTATGNDAYTNYSQQAWFNLHTVAGETYTLAWDTDDNVSGDVYVFNVTTVFTMAAATAKHVTFTARSSDTRFRLGVANSGQTIHYKNIRLSAGSTALPYQPYTAPVTTPLIPSTVEPLRSLPDGTRDVLRVKRDGSGEITRNVASATLIGAGLKASEYPNGFTLYSSPNAFGFVGIDMQKVMQGTDGRHPVLCDHLTAPSRYISTDTNVIHFVSTSVAVVNISGSYADTAAAKSAIDAMNAEITYPLATPTTETIPAAAMPALLSRYLTAWADGSDEDGASIQVEWEMEYERSLQVVIEDIESAIADL